MNTSIPPAGTATPQPPGPGGYKPAFPRVLNLFASFAAGFSYLSILTGMFQMFHTGYKAAGPAFFWTWPAVFVGQFLVALCFAELSAHYPLAGSVYQWSKFTGTRALGWLTGWVYLASYVVSLAAVVLALQVTLKQIAPWSQVSPDSATNAFLLGCLLVGFSTFINSVGVRVMARLNNIGVMTELVGAVLLVVLLAFMAVRGPDVVLTTGGNAAAAVGPLGYLGAFLAAAMMASFVMYGFDTAGALAEETQNASRAVPRAILLALAAAGTLGALLLLVALMAAPDLADPQLSRAEGGLPHILSAALGDFVGRLFLWNVIFAIVVCALAVHAGAVRLIFAMARDGKLPFSHALAHVSESSQTPVLPALVVGVLAVAVLGVNVSSTGLMEAVVAVAILWANLAYLMTTAPLLVRRLRGGWPQPEASGFSLGRRWGLLVNALAVLWGVGLIVNMAWPRPEVYGHKWHELYAAVLFTAGLLAAGAAYYWLVQRHRPDAILPEHRAASGS